MVNSAARTVAAHFAELPPERRAVICIVRGQGNKHLPAGCVEKMNWGMITWGISLSRYPVTYNKQPLSHVVLAAQKNNNALYLTGVDADSGGESAPRTAYANAGKKLDMGKCYLRLKTPGGLLFDQIAPFIAGTPVDDYIGRHEAERARK